MQLRAPESMNSSKPYWSRWCSELCMHGVLEYMPWQKNWNKRTFTTPKASLVHVPPMCDNPLHSKHKSTEKRWIYLYFLTLSETTVFSKIASALISEYFSDKKFYIPAEFNHITQILYEICNSFDHAFFEVKSVWRRHIPNSIYVTCWQHYRAVITPLVEKLEVGCKQIVRADPISGVSDRLHEKQHILTFHSHTKCKITNM